ncbi:MAG: hypothetical protein OXG78_02830 [Chloroflexi bacterium]|nr:hypothetical protein [Chloroflexota bacterium]
MNSETQHKSKATELELIVEGWERRHEWRLLSKTVPRSLIAALILGLVVGVVGYFRFQLGAEQLALIAGGLCALGCLLNLLYTLLFPRSLPVRAKYFDLEFGLQERVSTAFELMHGRIKTHPEIEARQIEDALNHARAIDPKAQITMDFRPRELAALLVFVIAMAGLVLLPAIAGEDFITDAPSVAVEAAEEDLREILETVATDTNLDDIDRQNLLDALEVALERLQEEEISEEEAFAAMSQLQSQLEEVENRLEDTVELDQSALEAALEALENFIPPSETEGESAEAAGVTQPPEGLEDLSQALEQMAQDAAEMSAEELAQAREALQMAADEIAQMNSEMAEQMDAMAEALEEGNPLDLQEQLDAAQEALSQEQGRQEQNENAQALLQEQSERLEEAAESIARQQSQEGQQQGQPEPGESGQRRTSQQGSQQEAEARSSADQGDQEAQRNRPASGESQRGNQDSRASGAGAGDAAPSNESLPGSAGEDQGADTNNNPTGNRRIEYEALYSPSGIAGGGQDEIKLETDANDTAIAEGDFDDNPIGESRVSYDTVFSDYQNAANRALESDYVPLGLRDIVRNYFTSLEPNSG